MPNYFKAANLFLMISLLESTERFINWISVAFSNVSEKYRMFIFLKEIILITIGSQPNQIQDYILFENLLEKHW